MLDRALYGTDIYGTNWNIGWDHVIHGPWTLDNDPFSMNMIMHPYMGSFNYGFARSAGLNFWESFGYTLRQAMSGRRTERQDRLPSMISG
jgi:hypothetical protein